jgi:hypothetical protein
MNHCIIRLPRRLEAPCSVYVGCCHITANLAFVLWSLHNVIAGTEDFKLAPSLPLTQLESFTIHVFGGGDM